MEQRVKPTTRQQYLDLFDSVDAAIEHENTCLSIGRAFLPLCAHHVLDDKESEYRGDDPIEPPAEYWEWLWDQMPSEA